MKKTLLFLLLIATFLLTGCSSESNDDDSPKNPGDSNNPVDVVEPDGDDDDDDDDDPVVDTGGATDLSVGVMLNETYNGDAIAYSLTIDSAGFYSIKSIGDIDLEGTLSDLSGGFVSYNDNKSDTSDDFEMIIYLESGTYLLGVSAVEDDVTFGLFSLMVESTSIAHVSVIGVNGMIADSIFPGSTNTVEFEVPSDGDVQLYTVSSVDTYGVVYDSNGTVVSDNDNGSNGDDFYIDTFLESGTYFIEISVNGDFSYADYELFYDHSGADLKVYEPISVDSFVAGTLLTGGAVAYYELTVTESVVVNIYTTGNSDLEGELYISKTAFMPFEYNDDGGDEYNFLMDNVALDAGTYYLHVYNLDYSVSDYELHVDLVD